jgi:prophage regulatory protein
MLETFPFEAIVDVVAARLKQADSDTEWRSIIERLGLEPENFSVPNFHAEKLLRLPTVMARTGLSRTRLYRLMSMNKFPQRIPLTDRTVGWDAEEVEQWIQSRRLDRVYA